jgi:hypothetical protein
MDFVQKIPAWLRWVLLLPSAVLAFTVVLVVEAVIHWVENLLPFFSTINFVIDITAALWFVLAGSAMAPRARKPVSVFLGLIVIAAAVFIVVGNEGHNRLPLWRILFDGLGFDIGAVVGVVSVFSHPGFRKVVER